MSNLRKLQSKSSCDANVNDSDHAGLSTRHTNSTRVNLFSTPNDHLAALVAANEKVSERESKMKSLFAKGKANKEQGLMQLHRKQWAEEYKRLHVERRAAEAEVEAALGSLSSLLLSDLTPGATKDSATSKASVHSTTTPLPVTVALKGLQDEFSSDAAVTNTIANRMLSEIFNIRAAVASAGVRGEEISRAREILESEHNSPPGSGTYRTASTGQTQNRGARAQPPVRSGSSGNSTNTARTGSSTMLSRGMNNPAQRLPASNVALSARTPSTSLSNGTSAAQAVGPSTTTSTSTNRHRSATMTSPEEDSQQDPEEKLLMNPHRLSQSELGSLEAKYKVEVTRLQQGLTQLRSTLSEELAEWNSEETPEIKWRKACHDYLGSMLRDLTDADGAKSAKRNDPNDQHANETDGGEEGRLLLQQEARLELGKLLTAAGVAPSLVTAADPTSLPSSSNSSQQTDENTPKKPQIAVGRHTTEAPSVAGSQFSTTTTALESSFVSASMTLEALEERVDAELSLLSRRFAPVKLNLEEKSVRPMSEDSPAANVVSISAESQTSTGEGKKSLSPLEALDAAFHSSVHELIGLFRAAISEKLMGLRDEVEGEGSRSNTDLLAQTIDNFGSEGHTGTATSTTKQPLTSKQLSSLPTNMQQQINTEQDEEDPEEKLTTASGITAATSAQVSLTASLSSKKLKSVDVAVVERIRELLPQYQQHRKLQKATGSNVASSSAFSSTTSRSASVTTGTTDLTSNKSKELFHHRIQLEFPNLSQHQIVSICRAIAEESKVATLLNARIKKVTAEIDQLLQNLKSALQAEEASVFIERERIEWAAAEAARKAEAMKELESLREAKQLRDAAALEERLAVEEAQKAEDARKAALRQAEFDERLRRLAVYQQEKAQLEEREKVLAAEEARILAEEERQRSLYNKARVAARDKKTQEALDQVRLEKLEIEQKLAEKEAQKERFFSAVQAKLGVARDPQRAIQLTESKKNTEAQFQLLGEATAGHRLGRHGFTDEDIVKDPRFRIHQALLSAGLQNTAYARDLISNGCGYKLSRHNAMSEGPGSFW